MFWSVLKGVWSFFWPESDSDDEGEKLSLEEEEREILKQINNYRNQNGDPEFDTCENVLGWSNQEAPNLKTQTYLCKTGTITFLCNDYGLIDDKFYFDIDCISPNIAANKNDRISYITAHVPSESEPAKIFKVCALSDVYWDTFGTQTKFSCGSTVKEFKAMRRIVNGKVTKLKERKFFVEPYNIWCNMNKLDTSFEPNEGDWVSLEASVSVDVDAIDLAGEIIDVISVRPSVVQNGTGRVTFWVDSKKEGVINSTVAFDKTVCDNMYIPSLGDLVSYAALESDQVKLKWRALWVKPDKLRLRESREKRLYKNKKGIVITQSLAVIDLKMDETKDVIVEVINRGTVDRVLLKTNIFNWDSGAEPQLSLKSPSSVEKVTLKPSEKLKMVVMCTGKKLGSTGELLEFHFEKFQIAKSFEINVLTDDHVEQLSNLDINDSRTKERKFSKRVPGRIVGNTSVWFGSKPFPSQRFSNGMPKDNYEVPKWLWRLLLGPGDVPKKTAETITCLRKALPYLAGGLSPDNYVERFRTLLHLEEAAIRIKFTSYAITEGVLEKRGDYWFLEVSGLAEGRPSILVGDRVILTRPWMNKATHVGYVHKVEYNGIHIDFHYEFTLNYTGEKCDVKFVPNTGTFVKCHYALWTAFSTLGKNFFFPSEVVDKPERVCFEVADEPVKETAPKGSEGGEKEKKTLIWNNKSLNERQKLAVVSVVRGHARPMPYILFGPPGTGKTTTMVEMIIQVYHLIPGSRVLICGPSNSSVDLLTERLIDSGLYKVGELIRLYAVSRLQNIPDKLKPYSDCIGTKTLRTEIIQTERKIKGSRATLGTFSTIGGLYGFASFEGHTFSHIFIDEAGQMTEPETLIPMCFFSKSNTQLVLAGDPKQLGPVCSSLVAARFDLEKSFLERLISRYPYKANREVFPDTSGFDSRFVTKLTLNYRSLPEIVNLPNQLFYDSDLVPLISENDSFEAQLLRRINIKVPKRSTHPAIIFHGVVGKNLQAKDSPSWYNLQEICQLIVYLRKIYESGLTADDVGVVTPYSKQVQKCRSELMAANLAVPQIGTVNNFQGQEKQVIILTTVRSSVEMLKRDLMFSLGFVASPRRLNVSLTRARTLLIILGNPNLLRVDPYWERVIDYCIKNKSYVGCTMKRDIKCYGESVQEYEDHSDSGDSFS